MSPTLKEGDRIFIDESAAARSSVRDGDIVAIRRDDHVIVKRVLAVAGETIAGDHRKISRNNKQLDEPYLAPASGQEEPELASFSVRTIAQGEFFVMGDNRDFSLDSRMAEFGPVKLSDIVGKYTLTYWHASKGAK